MPVLRSRTAELAKITLNLLRRQTQPGGEPPAVLRGWFGPDAEFRDGPPRGARTRRGWLVVAAVRRWPARGFAALAAIQP